MEGGYQDAVVACLDPEFVFDKGDGGAGVALEYREEEGGGEGVDSGG